VPAVAHLRRWDGYNYIDITEGLPIIPLNSIKDLTSIDVPVAGSYFADPINRISDLDKSWNFWIPKELAEGNNILEIEINNGDYYPMTDDLDIPQVEEGLDCSWNNKLNVRLIFNAPDIIWISPINCRSYVSLLGEDEVSTILDGEGLSRILMCKNDNNFSIGNMTVQNGNAPAIDPDGGGIHCFNSSPSLVNVTITGNSASGFWAEGSGGGIYCYESSPILQNVTISDNHSILGGGINCRYNSNPSLVNVTITDNHSISGGGINCWDSNPSLVNVTITGNSAWGGGGIACSNSNPELINCIMWNDTPQEIDGSATVTYSDIQGGWAGTGNIDQDPLFVGTGGYPFSLMEDSPCIDAGNPDPIYYDPEDPGNPGYALYPAMGTIINDMGAYGGPNAIGWPVVGLEDNVIVQAPAVFLPQNYPNPFNPTTTITFQLSADSDQEDIELGIYNIKGQNVNTLAVTLSSIRPGGVEGSATWNGTDNNNQPVSSGIYLYKLEAGASSKIKKMMLLK
jgi:flagellar hook capping protein FlgD/polymorphic membrane protein